MAFLTNIVGFCKKSAIAKLGKSDTYNMYVESKDVNENGFSIALKPMPGYEKVCDVEGKPQGLYRCSRSFNGKPAVYGVWGRKLYLITPSNTPYLIGSIAGSGRVQFCETSGYGKNNPHLVLCDGTNVYCVDTTLSYAQQAEYFKKHSPIKLPYTYPDSKTEIIKPSWIAYLYGYLLVGAEGTDIFYRSYQYPFEDRDPQTDAINYDIFCVDETSENTEGVRDGFGHGYFTMSEWQPDNTIVGCSNGSRLFTFGERSFQVFAYQNSKENPFVSPDTASQSIGIKTKDSLAVFGNSVFWLGSAEMGGNTIFMMDGGANPVRISTDEIEEQIASFDKSVVRAFVMRRGNHNFYVISFPINNITFAYDVRENGWIRLGSFDNENGERAFRYSNATTSPDDDIWMQGDGVLVMASENKIVDGRTKFAKWTEHDGTPITRKRVGGIISSDYNRFKVNKIEVVTNNGDYPLIKGESVKVNMRYSKDGSTFKSIATRRLGRAGEYGADCVFRSLGIASYLIVELSCSDNVPFALFGLHVDATKTNG